MTSSQQISFNNIFQYSAVESDINFNIMVNFHCGNVPFYLTKGMPFTKKKNYEQGEEELVVNSD